MVAAAAAEAADAAADARRLGPGSGAAAAAAEAAAAAAKKREGAAAAEDPVAADVAAIHAVRCMYSLDPRRWRFLTFEGPFSAGSTRRLHCPERGLFECGCRELQGNTFLNAEEFDFQASKMYLTI